MGHFGVTTKMNCELDLNPLIVKNQTSLDFMDANSFFELYLQDKNGDLIPVPVVINNFRDIDNQFPN